MSSKMGIPEGLVEFLERLVVAIAAETEELTMEDGSELLRRAYGGIPRGVNPDEWVEAVKAVLRSPRRRRGLTANEDLHGWLDLTAEKIVPMMMVSVKEEPPSGTYRLCGAV